LPALTPNIENRVRKLPKPSNATQSLQPLFEAVSNAMFAIEDEFDDRVSEGRIDISVSHLSDPAKITIEVADDGIGSIRSGTEHSVPSIQILSGAKAARAWGACSG
jgi:hypothetical protein